MLYEMRLPHKFDIGQLERVVHGKNSYERIDSGLCIHRKSSDNLRYYFNVYKNGRITLEAKSEFSARKRVYDVINWLKEEGFIILLEKSSVIFYPSILLKDIKVRPVKT